MDTDDVAELVEDFQEPAHVGALEVAGEVDGQGEVADGVLAFVLAVENLDGKFDAPDADPVDVDVSGVFRLLDVGQISRVVLVLVHFGI